MSALGQKRTCAPQKPMSAKDEKRTTGLLRKSLLGYLCLILAILCGSFFGALLIGRGERYWARRLTAISISSLSNLLRNMNFIAVHILFGANQFCRKILCLLHGSSRCAGNRRRFYLMTILMTSCCSLSYRRAQSLAI